jgi:hypothetical protein
VLKARRKNGSEDPPLHSTEDVELFLDAGKIAVAGEGGIRKN